MRVAPRELRARSRRARALRRAVLPAPRARRRGGGGGSGGGGDSSHGDAPGFGGGDRRAPGAAEAPAAGRRGRRRSRLRRRNARARARARDGHGDPGRDGRHRRRRGGGAAASGGGFVPSFEPGAGTLAVLDGPGPFAGGHPGHGEGPPAVGGRPPFFAPPRFERQSFERERNAIYGRGTRYTSSAAGTASAPARGDGGGGGASPFGSEDAWTRLRFDGARAGVGLVLSGEDEDMEDTEEHTARADTRDADDAEAWAERAPQEPGRGPGGPTAASTRQRGAARRAPLASLSGAKQAQACPSRRASRPLTRARGSPGRGPRESRRPQAGRARRFAPPGVRRELGPRHEKVRGVGRPHAAAPAAKSPRRLSPRASARAAEVVAMDAGGALLAGVSPVERAPQRGARSSSRASRRAPASLFAGTAPASAGAPETRRATRASSRRSGGE